MTSTQSLRPTKALEDALAEFRNLLSGEQNAQLQALTSTTPAPPGAEAILLFTAQIDSHNARRKSRCVASRIYGFLEAVQQFTTVVDTFVSSHPTIAALVWGGVRIFLLAASNFGTFFDQLTTCFMNVQRLCPRYAQYEFLYKDSLPLQQSLCTFYASLIRFCSRAMSSSQRQGYLQAAKSLFAPFQSEFGALRKEMEVNSDDIEKWIRFAADEAADQERKQVQKWRTSFHVFNDKDKDWKMSQEQRKRRSRNARLLDRLSDFDYRSALKRLRKKRFQNPNGLWLAKMSQYQDWLQQQKSSVFMLSGKMGSGKSVLSAAVTDEILLQQLPASCLRTFFFCEHENARSLTARTVLGSLARQCILSNDLPAVLETSLRALFEDNDPDHDDLSRFFVEQSDIARTHFIVIDGLDECSASDQELLLSTFKALLKLDKPIFKLFLSGRDDIGNVLQEELHPQYQLTMNCQEVSDDIEAVIDASLDEKQQKRKLVVQDPELIYHIAVALKAGAHGMFLWVDLMIEDLCVQACDDDMRDTIDHLPVTLAEVFERALLRVIKGGHSDIACKMFNWAAAARRPLSLEEMREAISIEPCQSSLKVGKLVTTIDRMISWSGNLLVLDEEERLVHFAHHSVREYLQASPKYQTFQKFHINLRYAQRAAGESAYHAPLMASAALPGGSNFIVNKSWTRLEKLLGGRSRPSANVLDTLRAININHERLRLSRSLQTSFRFLAYASEHWLDHTADLTEPGCKSYNIWRNLVVSDKPHVAKPWTAEQWKNGDICILRFIVDRRHLALCSLAMDLELARIYVSHEALSGNAWSDNDRAYFLEASRLMWNGEVGSEGVLNAGRFYDEVSSRGDGGPLIRVSPTTTTGGTTLGVLSDWTNVPSAEMQFSAPRARISTVCMHFALLAAAIRGDGDRLRTYLNRPSTVYLLVSEGRPLSTIFTLLEIAASNGHASVVEEVLTSTSFLRMLRTSNDTAFLRAFSVASALPSTTILSQIVKLIYLHWQEVLEIPSVAFLEVRLMPIVLAHLNAGSDVDLPSRITVIRRMMAKPVRGNANKLIASMLARAAVELAYETTGALHGWLANEDFELLVDLGADLAARDEQGRTPLSYAAFHGKFHVLEILIDRGADIDKTDNDGHSALHLAIAGKRRDVVDIVRILLDNGADINAVDNFGYSPLLLVLIGGNGREDVLRMLVDRGADVNATDTRGRSALHVRYTWGDVRVFRTLVEGGANVNAVDCLGRTALHCISFWFSRTHVRWTSEAYFCIELLLSKGADPAAIDSDGRTPGDLVGHGHQDIRDMLRARAGTAPNPSLTHTAGNLNIRRLSAGYEEDLLGS